MPTEAGVKPGRSSDLTVGRERVGLDAFVQGIPQARAETGAKETLNPGETRRCRDRRDAVLQRGRHPYHRRTERTAFPRQSFAQSLPAREAALLREEARRLAKPAPRSGPIPAIVGIGSEGVQRVFQNVSRGSGLAGGEMPCQFRRVRDRSPGPSRAPRNGPAEIQIQELLGDCRSQGPGRGAATLGSS